MSYPGRHRSQNPAENKPEYPCHFEMQTFDPNALEQGAEIRYRRFLATTLGFHGFTHGRDLSSKLISGRGMLRSECTQILF